MRRLTPALMLLTFVLSATGAAAQVRGKGRLQGHVVEQGTGKPVDGATVTLAPANGSTAPIVAKTNAKGRWAALGLTSGQWNVDIEAPGFTTNRGSVNVSESQLIPPIKTELAPVVEEKSVEVEVSGVPQEAVDAVNRGQDLVAEGKFAEAIVELEKALTYLPDNVQLKQLLAQAYYKTGDLKKAIALLEAVRAADAANTGVALLLTNIYIENDQLDQARALIATVPESAVTEPTIYSNIGVLFMNKANAAEAITYFDKAIALDANRAESYHYRGLAYVQLQKYAEAKADLRKVIELAPESPEAAEAKQLLDGLK